MIVIGIGGTVVTVGSDELFAGVAVMIAWKADVVTDATHPALDVLPVLQEQRSPAKQTTAIERGTYTNRLKSVRMQRLKNRPKIDATSNETGHPIFLGRDIGSVAQLGIETTALKVVLAATGVPGQVIIRPAGATTHRML